MSLLGGDSRPNPARRSRGKLAIDAKTVTTCIGVCPVSEWLLLSAMVLNNCMCVCRKSRATGGISYVILKSRCSVDVPSGGRGTITIPSFVGAEQVWSSVTTAEGCGFTAHDVRTMDCKPAFALIRSDKPLPPSSGGITSDLFLCLFGVGQRLSNSPALLIGSQNGNIYVTNFMACGEGIGANQRDKGELLCPLYSLEQPVVGIHTAFFPRRRAQLTDDPFVLQELNEDTDKDDNSTHNAIIFLGQGGKIAVCYVGSDGQSFPSFVEFHVPGPVLSSILIPNQCLLYSTLQGLHRVCLRQDCAASIEDRIPSISNTCPIKIPEVSFKFPEMLRHSYCGTYFLARSDDGGHGGQLRTPPTGTEGDEVQCVGVSLNGRLSTFQLASCADSRETTLAKNSSEVSREIKCCLQSVQKHSENMEVVMGKIQALNLILTELKGVLDILCAVGRADTALLPSSFAGSAPFSCSFTTTSERVGASLESLSVQVEVTYSGTEPDRVLTNGWSLLVTCQNGNLSTSKAASLAGLTSGDSVTLRVDPREGPTALGGNVSCFVHYNPRHLYESLAGEEVSSTQIPTTSKGVCIFLVRKDFDTLDFLSPHKHSNKRELLSSHRIKTVQAILSPEEAVSSPRPRLTGLTGPATAPVLLHTFSLPIPLHTAINTVQTCSAMSTGELAGMDTEEVGRRLLCTLLPTATGKLKHSNSMAPRGGGGGGAEILMGFDGERVSFKLSSSEVSGGGPGESGAVLRLEVHASSRACLVRVLSGVKQRLRKGRVGEDPPSVAESRKKLCGRLEELWTLQEEVGVAQQEISTAHQDSVTHCLSVEDYHQAIRTCENRVFTTYCKLREIP